MKYWGKGKILKIHLGKADRIRYLVFIIKLFYGILRLLETGASATNGNGGKGKDQKMHWGKGKDLKKHWEEGKI